jgi:hypothetical protein
MLNREAVFRLLLESRSLRLALARYHLTTPQALDGGEGAKAEAGILRDQLNVLADLDKVDFDRFASFADALNAKDALNATEQGDRVLPQPDITA